MWTRVRIVKYSFVPLTWSPRIYLSDEKKKKTNAQGNRETTPRIQSF